MFNVAVVGATGAVGGTMLRVLEERGFPVTELRPLASARSAGRQLDLFMDRADGEDALGRSEHPLIRHLDRGHDGDRRQAAEKVEDRQHHPFAHQRGNLFRRRGANEPQQTVNQQHDGQSQRCADREEPDRREPGCQSGERKHAMEGLRPWKFKSQRTNHKQIG